MNHRYEDRPFDNGERDRDRKRGQQHQREYHGSWGSGRFYPGSSESDRYGGRRRNDYEQGDFGRHDFLPEESPPYYGTGNYSSGGSGLGGGYRGMRGMGAHGPDELVDERRYGAGSAGTFGDWSRDEVSRGEYGRRDERQRSGALGRFFGRGPKGYKRSDERLREDISEQLMRAGTVDSSEVSIEVADGIVTLQGTVPERYMKHAIEDIVDRCLGVKDIDNRIRVQRQSWGSDDHGTAAAGAVSTTTATTAKTRKD